MERGEAVSVSTQSQGQAKQGKAKEGKARQAKDTARGGQGKASEGITKDDLLNYRRGEAQGEAAVLVVDAQTNPGGRPKTCPEKRRQAAELVLGGATVDGAAKVVGLAPSTVQAIISASGSDIEALEKELAPRKFKVAAMADSLLLQKLENDGHRMSGSELSIISGVATQRALDMRKLPIKEQPPDWSGLAGWAGADAGDEPAKE